VLPEHDILSDRDGLITFRICDNSGPEWVKSVSEADFLWMLQRLPWWLNPCSTMAASIRMALLNDLHDVERIQGR
jgi:hypothetical protein